MTKAITLYPLKFKEVIQDVLKVKPEAKPEPQRKPRGKRKPKAK